MRNERDPDSFPIVLFKRISDPTAENVCRCISKHSSWDLGSVVEVEAHSRAHLELLKMNGVLMHAMSPRFTLIEVGHSRM